jgi:hypothetical protein
VESCEPECTGTVPTTAIKCPNTENDLIQDFEWRRAENDSCSTTNKCEYYYKVDGGCNTDTTKEYAVGDTEFAGTFCSSGTPSPSTVAFPEYGEEVSWDCIGTGGGTSTNDNSCKASRAKPNSECGSSNNLNEEINNKDDLTSECADDNAVYPAGEILLSDGFWKWNCVHNYYIDVDKASENLKQCKARSCLAGELLSYPSTVQLKQDPNEQIVDVSIFCEESNPPKICCDIDATDASTNQKPTHVCTGDPKEIIIPSAGSYDARCYFDDSDCEDNSNCDESVDKIMTISTICTQRNCTSQGSCQSTPKVASNLDQCITQCNSNADCTSGRMIETKP